MKYRSRLDIASRMLDAANTEDGVPKTKIMYKASLSYAQLKQYTETLIENGLLEELNDQDKIRYRTTEMGIKLLRGSSELSIFPSK